jgi:hypothetical protein
MTDTRPDASRHSANLFVAATLVLLLQAFGMAVPADARVLPVGSTRVLKVPSQAATIAADGDVVRIDPGTYADCAVWRASRVTIEAVAPDVILRGKPCQGKGIFITAGADITIRGITFADARVVWHNGAGIRAEGANLTVENSRFLNNENGILAGGPPTSVVRITNTEFRGNGSCEAACAHGVYAGRPIGVLDIEDCVFADTRTAHHVKSRALTTILVHNRIDDGATGTSSYLINLPNGGNALIQDNWLRKGVHSDNPAAAISIGEEVVAKNPGDTIIVQDNQFASDLPEATIFVRNSIKVPVILAGNHLSGKVVPLDGPGTVEP